MNGAGAGDSRRELLNAWNERSQSSGSDASSCRGPEAQFLISSLDWALRRGSQTPELGRAARSWGARFTAPVEALAALSVLRGVVLEATSAPGVTSPEDDAPVTAETVNKVMDQLMLEAVDAASVNLRVQARTDPLTGCANRLALNEDLTHAANSATRSGLDLALAAVDLDGLKRINDTRGHKAGDAALQALVARLRSALRDADTLYRTGGDEFVVVAPFTDATGAAAMLQRALESDGPRFSWGVASMRAIGQAALEDPELLVIAADTDLYARRRSSRDDAGGAAAATVAGAVAGASAGAVSAAAAPGAAAAAPGAAAAAPGAEAVAPGAAAVTAGAATTAAGAATTAAGATGAATTAAGATGAATTAAGATTTDVATAEETTKATDASNTLMGTSKARAIVPALTQRTIAPALVVIGSSVKRSKAAMGSAGTSVLSGSRRQRAAFAAAATSAVVAARRHRVSAASVAASLLLLVAVSVGLVALLDQGTTPARHAALGGSSGSRRPSGSGQSNSGSPSSPSTSPSSPSNSPSRSGGGTSSNSAGGTGAGASGSTSNTSNTSPSGSGTGSSSVSGGSSRSSAANSGSTGSSATANTSGNSGKSGTPSSPTSGPSGSPSGSGTSPNSGSSGSPGSGTFAGPEQPASASPSETGNSGVSTTPASGAGSSSPSSFSATTPKSTQLSEEQIAEAVKAFEAKQFAEAVTAAEADAAVRDEQAVIGLREAEAAAARDAEAAVAANHAEEAASAATTAVDEQKTIDQADALRALEVAAAVKALWAQQHTPPALPPPAFSTVLPRNDTSQVSTESSAITNSATSSTTLQQPRR
jgi:trimeric autotransporter adhesin